MKKPLVLPDAAEMVQKVLKIRLVNFFLDILYKVKGQWSTSLDKKVMCEETQFQIDLGLRLTKTCIDVLPWLL